MATTAVPISHLNTEPEVIRCPACQNVGKTIRVMDMISDGRGAGNAAMGILGCLFCNCDALLAPTYYSLAHYCPRCGIRLVVVPWQADPILQLDSKSLVNEGKGAVKIAPSPLGAPPRMDEAQLRADRHTSSVPSSIYEIKLGGEVKLPTGVYDATGARMIYRIEWPGFRAGRGTALSPVEYTPTEAMSAEPKPSSSKLAIAWDPTQSTPHIRVFSPEYVPRDIATAQVFGDSKDFILHTPATTEHDGRVLYTSRRSGAGNKSSPSAGHLVWTSCAGPLTWTLRKVRDAEMPKHQRCIVLLDAYDRLLAVVRGSELKTARGDEAGFQLRVYGEVSETLLGEIVASFSAVCYGIWNYAQLGVPDVGLNLAAAGVAVAGAGVALVSL